MPQQMYSVSHMPQSIPQPMQTGFSMRDCNACSMNQHMQQGMLMRNTAPIAVPFNLSNGMCEQASLATTPASFDPLAAVMQSPPAICQETSFAGGSAFSFINSS